MVKKIIITGGLGYIGTELCKIYSGFSWHHKILVIDNNLAHAIEDLRRETEGIDLLPICPNFDELKVKEIAKKILDMKSK